MCQTMWCLCVGSLGGNLTRHIIEKNSKPCFVEIWRKLIRLNFVSRSEWLRRFRCTFIYEHITTPVVVNWKIHLLQIFAFTKTLLSLTPWLNLQHFTRKHCLPISGLRTRSVTWNRFPIKIFAGRLDSFVETNYSSTGMCKSESLESHESWPQSADSSKSCSKCRAFNCPNAIMSYCTCIKVCWLLGYSHNA